ncbi:MAG: DUF885 family protein, partial [Thermoanaerobaculia bacterium]
MRYTLMLLVMMATGAQAGVVEGYLEAYFEMFPTRATAAGLHDLDHSLEDLSPTKISEWVGFNRSVAEDLKASLGNPELEFEDRLDAELLLREAELQLLDLDRLRRPQKDPLYWTGVVSQATVFLLVREDRPRHDRLAAVASRVEQIPRFAAQAQSGLAPTATDEIAPELCRLASRQAQASAQFYAEGLAAATTEDDDADLRQRLGRAGEKAATALTQLAAFLDELGKKATGSPRLGEDYRARFEIVNGMTTPLAEVLDGANEDLAAKLREAAEYGRSVWEEVMGDEDLPASDKQVVAALFQRVSDDRASTTDEFIADYRQLVDESVAFVRQKQIITLPEPLTLFVGRSPDFFIGQSVGGVYPAGPFAADDAKTLLFLPTPPADATQEELEGFFRDFNHHFNVMITPHELIPGHYLQLKWAARHPRKVRALFGDGVY